MAETVTIYQMHVRSYIILWSGEGLTSFNIDNSANFLGEKKKKMAMTLSGVSIFWEYTLSQISFSRRQSS